MRTKTKLLVTIFMFVGILIATVFIVVSAYASTKNDSSTNFQMLYNAESDCKATISGVVYNPYKPNEYINIEIDGKVQEKELVSSIEIYNDGYLELAITNNQTKATDDVADLLISQQFTISSQINIKISKQISFNDKNNYESITEDYIRLSPNQTVYIEYVFEIIDIADYSKLEAGAYLSFKHIASYGQISKNMYGNIIGTEGEYPQTYVGDTLNETLKSKTLTSTGGYSVPYWVEYGRGFVEKTTYTAIAYTYNGQKIAKLHAPDYADGCKLSTGDEILEGQYYYFYVQPIKVVLMEVRNNKGIYTAKNLLFSTQFNNQEIDYNRTVWEYSVIREYLNDTFYYDAKLSGAISQTELENDSSSLQQNTYDYIWMPSLNEWFNWYKDESNNALCQKKVTDFAIITGINCYSYDNGNSYSGDYWLRTEYPYQTDRVYAVSFSGGLKNYNYFEYAYGVALCFAIG